jgi:vacuolar protein sorting-associated protein 18
LPTNIHYSFSFFQFLPLQNGAFEALRVLNDAPFELAESLYYKHASVLLSLAPAAATESFLAKYSHGLSPLRLLPSIMHYEKMRAARARVQKVVETTQHQSYESGGVEETKSAIDYFNGPKESPDGFEFKIESTIIPGVKSLVDDASISIKYLEGVIQQGCCASAVFNYLVSLYAKIDDEDPLFYFLTSHVPASSTVIDDQKRAIMSGDKMSMSNDEASGSPLDLSYALRIVLGSGRHFRSAIKLYMGFGMRQQAVELALKVDPTLARQLAQDSVDLEERKRLWLMIAKTAATSGSGGKDVVSRVVSVLRDCGPDVLSIEDVLPFLYVALMKLSLIQ